MKRNIEQIPEWAICYIVNGDATGLEDEEIQQIDSWIRNNRATIYPPIDGPYFCHYPAWGLASDVYDCIVDYDYDSSDDNWYGVKDAVYIDNGTQADSYILWKGHSIPYLKVRKRLYETYCEVCAIEHNPPVDKENYFEVWMIKDLKSYQVEAALNDVLPKDL